LLETLPVPLRPFSRPFSLLHRILLLVLLALLPVGIVNTVAALRMRAQQGAEESGPVRCASDARPAGPDISALPHMRGAMRADALLMGEYRREPLTGAGILPFARPFHRPDGTPGGAAGPAAVDRGAGPAGAGRGARHGAT